MESDKLRILRLRGSLADQGQQYGEAERDTIASAQREWENDVRASGLAPESVAGALAGESSFLNALHQYAPRFMSFIGGVAVGANQPLHRVLAQNMMDEDWWIRRGMLAAGQAFPNGERCSSIAGPAREGMLAGQNLDIQPWVEGTQLVLQLEAENDLKIMVAAVGGVPSCGVNSAGVSTLLNTVIQLRSTTVGLPVCGFQFECLFQPSALSGYGMLCSTPHASGHAYTIVDRHSLYATECSADGVVQLGLDSRGFLMRTNHPLGSTSLRNHYVAEERALIQGPSTTHQRLRQLRESIGADTVHLSLESIKAALSCRAIDGAPVSRHLDDVQRGDGAANIGYTSLSVIAELPDVGAARLHVAPGPPAITAFKRFDFQ